MQAPWGLEGLVNYTPAGASAAVNGSQRAWKWLADKSIASKSSVLSIEKGDTLNIIAYELKDKVPSTTLPNPPPDVWDPAVPQWVVMQWTVSGASSLQAFVFSALIFAF